MMSCRLFQGLIAICCKKSRGDALIYRILLLGCMFLTGCSLFVTKPQVAVKAVNIAGINRGGVQLEFLIAFTNPNSYNLKLMGYSYSLFVSVLPLAKGENREVVEFAGNATTDVKLPVKITFQELLKILNNRPDFDHIPYQLKADLDLQAPFGRIAIPVNKNGTFAVPRRYQPSHFLKQINEFLK
jgi:LEA14-like dessication related protein